LFWKCNHYLLNSEKNTKVKIFILSKSPLKITFVSASLNILKTLNLLISQSLKDLIFSHK
jgi:hypothetical protein